MKNNSFQPPASTGICVPDSCSSTEIKGILIAGSYCPIINEPVHEISNNVAF